MWKRNFSSYELRTVHILDASSLINLKDHRLFENYKNIELLPEDEKKICTKLFLCIKEYQNAIRSVGLVYGRMDLDSPVIKVFWDDPSATGWKSDLYKILNRPRRREMVPYRFCKQFFYFCDYFFHVVVYIVSIHVNLIVEFVFLRSVTIFIIIICLYFRLKA